jgi:tetrahydromethanopterin S-methyltransferase subunit F
MSQTIVINGRAHHMLRWRGAITVSCSAETVGDTLEGVVVVSILMSLTVFDVTVRSSAIIMLSMIAFWFATRGRTRAQFKPVMVRVDNKRPYFYQQLSRERTLKSAGLLGLSGLAIGILFAVVLSVLATFVFSRLTGSLGN